MESGRVNELTELLSQRIMNGGPTDEEREIEHRMIREDRERMERKANRMVGEVLELPKIYPKYRIVFEKISKVMLDADISVVEALGILELVKYDIAEGGGD